MNIEHDNNIITLVKNYATNSENLRIEFFKKVIKWISKFTMNDENIIFVGDLNCKVYNDRDKGGI